MIEIKNYLYFKRINLLCLKLKIISSKIITYFVKVKVFAQVLESKLIFIEFCLKKIHLFSGNKISNLNATELKELSCFAAHLGLWSLLPIFNIHRGLPNLILIALKSRVDICRGALNLLVRQRNMVPLLDENSQFLFDFISSKCYEFDAKLLKVNYFGIFVYLFK